MRKQQQVYTRDLMTYFVHWNLSSPNLRHAFFFGASHFKTIQKMIKEGRGRGLYMDVLDLGDL